jgi:salicylate synthetase
MPSSPIRTFAGSYDHLETFRRLCSEGIIQGYSYLYTGRDYAEIGWEPISHVKLLSGVPCYDWHGKLADLARTSALVDCKAVGYIGFDAVDDDSGTLPDGSRAGLPLIEFMIPGEVITFTGSVVTHRGRGHIDVCRYLQGRANCSSFCKSADPIHPSSETSDSTFLQLVQRAIAILSAGDLQKIVLSRYQAYEVDFDSIALLAKLSHSECDTFLLNFGDLVAIVPSPEVLLSARDRHIVTNPLAGTRRRGQTPEEDEGLRSELRGNHKELVEHVLSVTTMLSELEAVCEQNTLVVARLMDVAVQKKVQHLSSVIKGTLRKEAGVLDALWALFPGVTVTGVPKRAALKIVRELEGRHRYLYAGVVGWMYGSSDCRFSLAIRSVFRYGIRSFLQAGAGIMAESIAEAELLEISQKLSAIREAIACSL